MRLLIFALVAALVELSLQQVPGCNVNWQPGDWAMDCDFQGNDIAQQASTGELCSTVCRGRNDCTHYAWNLNNGGTCYLKGGPIIKQQAICVYGNGQVCGTTRESGGGYTWRPGALAWSVECNDIGEVNREFGQEIGGHGWGNNELQYYTGGNANIWTQNGECWIQARKENVGGMRFTSTRLISNRGFRHGNFEIRARLPFGRGTWPAFWLLAANRPLNWPGDGEIDILEHVGYDMNVVHATIHCNTYNHMIGTQIGSSIRVNDVVNQWHLYQTEWTPTSVTAFVDGQFYFRYNKPGNAGYNEWPFDNAHNIIINIAVGGGWGGVQGIDENIWPQNFVFDYVRVYNL